MNRTGSPPPLWGAAGKAGYVLSCIAASLVLAISGFSYFVVKDVSDIGGSHAIVSGPSIGAQNILLMGLESRTDWNGNILPDDVLKALHACNAAEIAAGCGGNATNTLILIHIFANGGKAVGFSIPRDDWVTFPTAYDGQTQGKVDQAYGLALAAEEYQLRQQNPGLSQDQIAFEGNEAGRAAEVATVEQLTGVHIDHFAELNLDGFYELAKVVGGVEVCLTHPVPYDPYSGFSAAHAGYQHLSAKMALAFVRQRHGLTNGDFDRTKRQQAVIDSVTKALRTDGVLGDLGKLNGLLSVAKQYLITDSGWNLLDFISQMRGLSLGNVTFRTLPEVAPITIDGQDANEINVPQIQQIIQQAFYPAPRRLVLGLRAPLGPGHGGQQPGHRGRLQRRQHPGPGRTGLGRPGQGRVHGRQGREHQPAHHDRGALRHGRGGQRQQDRVDVQRDRLGQLDAGGRPRRGPARRGRHPAQRRGQQLAVAVSLARRRRSRPPPRGRARSAPRTAFPASTRLAPCRRSG